MFSLARKFLVHVVPGVIRPFRILWNEIIGFIFLVLGLWTVPTIYRGIRDFTGDAGSFWRLLLTGFFGLVMVIFAYTSFRRARQISRSSPTSSTVSR